ncbi:Flp family type IVb pilin [Mesorhizobium sp. VNQ89]|uniref:Flp family type IVb pilin n=1 Tax=Mesorhizobium quangtriensis TaxID=3157709 RepID=UPI0032B83EE2
MQRIREFLADTSGATGIEYGLIVGLITLAIVAGVGAVGNEVGDMFGNQDRELQRAFNR